MERHSTVDYNTAVSVECFKNIFHFHYGMEHSHFHKLAPFYMVLLSCPRLCGCRSKPALARSLECDSMNT